MLAKSNKIMLSSNRMLSDNMMLLSGNTMMLSDNNTFLDNITLIRHQPVNTITFLDNMLADDIVLSSDMLSDDMLRENILLLVYLLFDYFILSYNILSFFCLKNFPRCIIFCTEPHHILEPEAYNLYFPQPEPRQNVADPQHRSCKINLEIPSRIATFFCTA
jgi:hypothetical protein